MLFTSQKSNTSRKEVVSLHSNFALLTSADIFLRIGRSSCGFFLTYRRHWNFRKTKQCTTVRRHTGCARSSTGTRPSGNYCLMDTRHPLYQLCQIFSLLGRGSHVVPDLFGNLFFRQDACFEFRVGVASINIQKVAYFRLVEFGYSVFCQRVVNFTITFVFSMIFER